MLDIGRQLFSKIHKRKRSTNHNHEIHYLAREINDWLPQGIESMAQGSYTSRHLKRYYFADEMVDQLHVSDRILQHIFLKQLKPTFKFVMSENCYHLLGPTGVKFATQRIRQVLEEEKPNYVMRVDIKSFYKSIQHHKLIQDIKKIYDDPKVQTMLENVIRNPIDTPYGYKNPGHGIALRGPLSQFFSGIFLKPLDDAFDNMQVTYLRYQDDIVIFCKTKRQLNRCRKRMMEILYERRLSLSRKKTRMGCITRGFHFLGIHYLPTRTADNINTTHANDDLAALPFPAHTLSGQGGRTGSEHQVHEPLCIVPHPRTLRKARENVKWMVNDGASLLKTRNYLHRFVIWWVKTSEIWTYEDLLNSFIRSCRESTHAAVAYGLLGRSTLSSISSSIDCLDVA